jgi:hypothetical protein
VVVVVFAATADASNPGLIDYTSLSPPQTYITTYLGK